MSLTFRDYREIPAKFGGTQCKCGHVVRVGERIGWSKWDRGNVICETCWQKWKDEVKSEEETRYY